MELPISKGPAGLFILLSDAVKALVTKDIVVRIDAVEKQVATLVQLVDTLVTNENELKGRLSSMQSDFNATLEDKELFVKRVVDELAELQKKIAEAASMKVFNMTLLESYQKEHTDLLELLKNGIELR